MHGTAAARCVVYELQPAGPVRPPIFRARRHYTIPGPVLDAGTALSLASNHCARCLGTGQSPTTPRSPICDCVYREIFRRCFERYREIRDLDAAGAISPVYRELVEQRRNSRGNRFRFSRRQEEYLADFVGIAHRTLDDLHRRIFRYHFLLGADWRLCTRRLGIDRGNFFHGVYRLEKKLGRAYLEASPYALFPTGDYFATVIREKAAAA